jgi:hypothetical protein
LTIADNYPPLRILRSSGVGLTKGVEQHRIDGVAVRVTSVARTVADCFKFRNMIGLDVALEALREGWAARRVTSHGRTLALRGPVPGGQRDAPLHGEPVVTGRIVGVSVRGRLHRHPGNSLPHRHVSLRTGTGALPVSGGLDREAVVAFRSMGSV